MGREVRKVPKHWSHPIDTKMGHYRPLFDGARFRAHLNEWNEENAKWHAGEFPDYASEESKRLTYSEWAGDQPKTCDYMPEWAEAERTHYMMYESTSEGTPISPAFETPEELARWLADTGASSFGSDTASYEAWLRVAKGSYAPSAVYTPETGLISGVEASQVVKES